jgi:hypothetical protein
MIEAHEDFAVFALVSSIILGVASVAGLFLTLRKSALVKTAAMLILFISLINFGLAARTGYLGGQIRHTEINNQPSSTQGQTDESKDDD